MSDKNAADYIGKVYEQLLPSEQECVDNCDEITVTHEGIVIDFDDAIICEHCGNVEAENEAWTDYGREHFYCSEECIQEECFWCDRSEEYYHNDIYDSVYIDGETVCREIHQDEIYYWESDDEYHWEPEPDEDDDSPSEYHSAPRPWRRVEIPALALGCELECYSFNRSETVTLARELGFIAERDGSLSDAHGVEIIGNPHPLEYYSKNDNAWKSFCDNAKGVRCFEAKGDYGLHVSINVSNESQLAVSKAILFVNANESFCELVAQRSANRYNNYKKHIKIAGARALAADKYCATNYNQRQGRLEFRIFRANRKWSAFKRAVEFTHAAFTFSRESSMQGLKSPAFCNWIASNPLRKKGGSYPELSKFLTINNKG